MVFPWAKAAVACHQVVGDLRLVGDAALLAFAQIGIGPLKKVVGPSQTQLGVLLCPVQPKAIGSIHSF